MRNINIGRYQGIQGRVFGISKLGYVLFMFFLVSCSDFVEVDLPKNRLTSEAVFMERSTAEAALKGIYSKMRDRGLTGLSGLSALMGLYADELDDYTLEEKRNQFQNHNLVSTNPDILRWWNDIYNQIYEANTVLEGVAQSKVLNSAIRDQFTGEALFIRAYLHLILVELFGDIPFIETTDYVENTNAARTSKALVYDSIIADLSMAASLLPEDETNVSDYRVRAYAATANAVLARTYLYAKNWNMAEIVSTGVIDRFGGLEPDLNKVFLKEASGTIWQFIPEFDGQITGEAGMFIFNSLSQRRNFALNETLINAFEPGDMRKNNWTRPITDGTDTLYHAYKYKEEFSSSSSIEYSVQLRLAEQYLIRAEARAMQGKILEAQEDVNTIRNRAGLENTTADTLNDLLEAILHERQVEFFTEHGHRWFDLKRLQKAREILEPIKPGWRDTDSILPIPEAELLLNPNLLPQNEGY